MRPCGTPTETPLFQHGHSLLPVTDCQLLCSGRWPSKLKKVNFVLSVLLKRADWREVPPSIGRDSWGDLVRLNKLDRKFFLQRYLWSPEQIEMKFLSAEISMESLASLFLGPWSPNFWLTQASTQLVSIHISFEKYENLLFLSIRSTQTTFPDCLSTQCHFDQHRGFFLSLDKFANLVKPRSVASLELPPMSWTMIVWVRRGLRRPRERLVVMFFKVKQWFFIVGDSPICLLALSSICRGCMANQLKKLLTFFAQRASSLLPSKWHFDWRE